MSPMSWKILYYNEQVQELVNDLPKNLKARYYYLTDIMLMRGANLGEPHTESMRSGLFELRVKAKEGIARAFFCTLIGQRIKKELELAKKRLKEVKLHD